MRTLVEPHFEGVRRWSRRWVKFASMVEVGGGVVADAHNSTIHVLTLFLMATVEVRETCPGARRRLWFPVSHGVAGHVGEDAAVTMCLLYVTSTSDVVLVERPVVHRRAVPA